MQKIQSLSFLRRVLLLDAVSSGAMGVALFTLGSLIAPLLGLPDGLLREAGLVLMPFAVFVGYLASQQQPSRAGVWVVIAVNAIWTVDSIALLFTGWVAPTVLGIAFVIGQALIVGVFAQLQYIAVRRSKLVSAK